MTENSTEQNSSDAIAVEKPGNPFTWIFHPFGARAMRLNGNLGAIAIFFLRAFILIFHPKQISAIIQQVYFIGVKSAQIVMLGGFSPVWYWACNFIMCWSNSGRWACWGLRWRFR
jgi:ABC-type transporter Mla maintaining outer membrane lipid asymmetry permease subunit MlaE